MRCQGEGERHPTQELFRQCAPVGPDPLRRGELNPRREGHTGRNPPAERRACAGARSLIECSRGVMPDRRNTSSTSAARSRPNASPVSTGTTATYAAEAWRQPGERQRVKAAVAAIPANGDRGGRCVKKGWSFGHRCVRVVTAGCDHPSGSPSPIRRPLSSLLADRAGPRPGVRFRHEHDRGGESQRSVGSCSSSGWPTSASTSSAA